MQVKGSFGTIYLDMKATLGKGASAKVFAGCFSSKRDAKCAKVDCAVKWFTSPDARNRQSTYKRESEIYKQLARVPHPGIVQLIDCSTQPVHWIAMECFGLGDLEKQVIRKDRFTPVKGIGTIAKGLLEAVRFLNEEQKIFHGDLKPGNVLVDDKYNIKVIDFSNSRSLEKGLVSGNWCSWVFASPKAILELPHGDTDDVWAVAAIVYRVIAKKYLASDGASARLRIRALEGEIAALERGPSGLLSFDNWEKEQDLQGKISEIEHRSDDESRKGLLKARREVIGTDAPEGWQESHFYPEDRPAFLRPNWEDRLVLAYGKGELTVSESKIIREIAKLMDGAIQWEPASASAIMAKWSEGI